MRHFKGCFRRFHYFRLGEDYRRFLFNFTFRSIVFRDSDLERFKLGCCRLDLLRNFDGFGDFNFLCHGNDRGRLR